MRLWLLRAIESAAHAIASWARRTQAVDPWQPGHSIRERMQALDREMVWTEEKD